MSFGRIGRWVARIVPLLLLAAAALPAAGQVKRAEPPLRLLLNVPENRLYVYEDGELRYKFRIAVGLPGYETPAGSYSIHNVIWNPWWHPPDSEWARGRKPERPGSPTNPMGRVKLLFDDLLYIHGTPELQSLGRASSRGCVRMDNRDLLVLTRLVHEHASPNVSEELLARLEANPTENRTIPLRTGVPFKVVYNVAEIANGFLHLYPDLYGLVGKEYEDQVWSVLEANGIDARDVHMEKLERLLRKGPTRKVAMSLDTLLTAEGSVTSSSHR